MRNLKRLKLSAVIVISALFIISLVNKSYAAENTVNKIPIEITSESMIAEDRNNVITFNGSVKAKKENIIIYSDTLVVHYSEKRELKSIIASGNVKLVQEDREILSEKAEYSPADDTIVFTGNPEFRENGNTVKGSMITYIIPLEKSVVENSKVLLR